MQGSNRRAVEAKSNDSDVNMLEENKARYFSATLEAPWLLAAGCEHLKPRLADLMKGLCNLFRNEVAPA